MQFVIIRYMDRINCTKRVPKDLKNADVIPVFKKDNPILATTTTTTTTTKIDQQAFYQQFLKYMKE